MTIKEILRETAGQHIGYVPQNVAITKFDPEGICPRLKTIPNKISAYFHADKIKAVYKSNHARHAVDNYYIIRAKDNTLFHVEY